MIEPDPTNPLPLYLQIADELRRLIAVGALRPGDRVPTVRELAVRARVNRNTAARAIQLLESQGVVRTRVGQGTFVEQAASELDRTRREAAVDTLLDQALDEAHTLGMSSEELARRLDERAAVFVNGSRATAAGGGEEGSA